MTLHAVFTRNQNEVTTGELFQWDTGQQLCIEGLTDIDENTKVHFANNRMNQAIVKTGTFENEKLTVDIPNEFLQSGGVPHGRAWVYVTESDTVGQTIKTINIPIVPRTRPNDYVSPTDPDSKGIVERALEILKDGTKASFITVTSADAATKNGTIYYVNGNTEKYTLIPTSTAARQVQLRIDSSGRLLIRKRYANNSGVFPAWGSFTDISAGVDPEVIQEVIQEIVEEYIAEHGIADGKSAYEIAVEHGYEGTEAEWLESLHGADGAPGAKGDKGDKGETGAQGVPGANGKDGAKGDKGDKGERGIKGDSITAAYRDSVSKHLMLTRTVYDENGTPANTPIDVGAVNGRHGNSLQNVSINSNGELETTIRVYDDSDHYNDMIGNLGRVVGADGAKGDKGDKGDPGDDYVLTDADKTAIATAAAGMIDVSGKADKDDTYTKSEVDAAIQTAIGSIETQLSQV